jgi:PAS domain S-box-containing protein
MWVYDRETLRLLAVNDAAVARYGWSREEFLGLTLRDIRPPEDVPALERSVAATPDAYSPPQSWRHRARDGSVFEVEITAHAVEFKGRPARAVLAVDVSERRRAEQQVRWLQRAVEQTDSAIFLTDPEGRITYVNPSFEALYGYTADQVLGETPRLLKSGEMSPEHYESLWHTLRAGRNYRGTHVNRCRQGRLVTVDASVTPLRGPSDEIVGFVAIHTDVTERRGLEEKRAALEAQLVHAQRFEALGTLAAGMAHDFNNLLGIVLGHAAALARVPGDAERVALSAEALRLAGERGASVVRRVLAFARRSETRCEVLDAWAASAEVERLLREILPRGVTLTLSADPGRALVWADRGQLQQVLINLCLNARDAMPRGGTLALRVAHVAGAVARERLPDAAAAEYVEISVTDTGAGMNERTRQRVFEPFFTTKAAGQGSGLGLSVVYGIVKAHGGTIEVESAEGRGTVFRLLFPLCPGGSPAKAAPRAPGRGGVLLVEDEPMLQEIGRAWLEDAGYSVLSAADGEEALELVREHGERLSAVLCDLGLPRLGGRELFFELRRLRPSLPVVLLSGFVEPTERIELAQAGAAGFLQKPYGGPELLDALEQALAAGR